MYEISPKLKYIGIYIARHCVLKDDQAILASVFLKVCLCLESKYEDKRLQNMPEAK
jgi:hypothetical protein